MLLCVTRKMAYYIIRGSFRGRRREIRSEARPEIISSASGPSMRAWQSRGVFL